MSLTIDQVLADAKRLVERLRDHDNAADSLIEQSSTLNKRIEAMKQYQEEVEEMNSVARHRPRSALILGIQQENRQIRELQRENRELRVALEEHQSALDLIMSSYREQVCKMLIANRFDRDCLDKHAEYQENSIATTAKIIEMAAVMKQAILLEEKTSFDFEQQLTRLQVENRGLRELLEISRAIQTSHLPVHRDAGEKKVLEKDVAAVPIIVINKGAFINVSGKQTSPRSESNLALVSKVNSASMSNDTKPETGLGEREDIIKASPSKGTTSPSESSTSPSKGTSPSGGSTTSPSEGSISTPESSTSPSKGTTSPPESNTSPLKGTSPLGGSKLPSKGTSTSGGSTTSPSEGSTSPPESSTSPSKGTSPPKGTSPSGGSTSPSCGSTSPLKGTTSLSGGSTSILEGKDSEVPGGGVVDLEVENVLNAFADMTASLDMDDTDSDA